MECLIFLGICTALTVGYILAGKTSKEIEAELENVERNMEYELPLMVIVKGTPGIELYGSLEVVETNLEPPEVTSGLYRVFDIEGREFRPFVDSDKEWTALEPAPYTHESKTFLEQHLRERLRAALDIDSSTMDFDELLKRLAEEYDRGRTAF